MRQLTCKSLSLILINLFLFTLIVQAQDTSKVIKKAPAKTVTQPAKKAASPAAKTAAPQGAAVTQPAATTNPPAAPLPADNSLNGQYEALLKNSWMQQGYKVINPGRLTTLWKSVNDTLINTKKQLADSRRIINEQEKQLADLKTQPAPKVTNTEIKAVAVKQIEVLGMAVDLATYNWIVWGTILALALGLAGILLTKAKNSMDSKQYKDQYEEISSEYQTYKAKAKEKELRLARELQTERNTIEDLLAKQTEEPAAKRAKK
ncbi:MAG: hypothetical protein H7Y13_05980 [Sphingobacteriaceae bacterium]|nr:hypothetical protein [Sphingobacteriaceae bacterium]